MAPAIFGVSPGLRGQDRRLRADSPSCQQPPPDEEQGAKSEQREELGPALGGAAVPGLYVAELALEDPEAMRDTRAPSR